MNASAASPSWLSLAGLQDCGLRPGYRTDALLLLRPAAFRPASRHAYSPSPPVTLGSCTEDSLSAGVWPLPVVSWPGGRDTRNAVPQESGRYESLWSQRSYSDVADYYALI